MLFLKYLRIPSTRIRTLEWFKLISITATSQLVIQGVGIISGILIIRILSIQQYAFYTLANATVGTMSILADGGISIAVMAQSGKVWQNKERLGVVLATGIFLRRRFAFFSLIIAIPILFYLLQHHNSNWYTSFFICASLIPTFFSSISAGIYEIVPRLHQDIKSLQKNQIIVSILRLLLSTTFLVIVPLGFVAILVNGIPRILGNLSLKKIAQRHVIINTNNQLDTEIRDNILKVVRRIFPTAVYIVLSGQISVFTLSFFGNTRGIAQVGALGRIALILNIFLVLYSILIIPRFARLSNDPRILLGRYVQVQLSVICVSIFSIAVAYLYSPQLLWILGKDYLNLHSEFLLMILASCLNLVVGVSFTLYSSRGWTMNPFLAIFVSLTSMVGSLFFLDISSMHGVLMMSVYIGIAEAITHFSFGIYKISRIKAI